jgi:hypothetical protein
VIVPHDLYCDVVILGMDRKHGRHCHLRVSTMTATRISELSQVWGPLCSTARAAEDNHARGISQVNRLSQERQDPLLSFLSELWTSLVYPIMEYLNILVCRTG